MSNVPPRTRIGDQTADRLERLAELARRLGGSVEPDGADAVGALLDSRLAQPVTVGVVGQVKAGKSTLVNALVERPGLLSTDANPWTAAVTRLHFGRPGGPEEGAKFTFFDAAEWDHMAHDGGRAGELAGTTIEGWDREELAEHMATMKRNAERRLGQQFKLLLGKTHRFETLTPEILQRYVVAGDTPERALGRDDAPGRFAEITKEANLFLERAPFGPYCCVLDTPGTNDPLLVRGEVTRRHLGQVDIALVVMTAQQAMSTSDLAILRLLAGLHKDRVVIVVNRVDGLSDPVAQTPQVVDHVRRALRGEFPNREIPVVATCGWWGEVALAGDERLKAELARPVVRDMAIASGLGAGRSIASWADTEEGRERGRALLWELSGLDTLRDTVSAMIDGDVTALGLQDGLRRMARVAHSAQMRADARRTELLGAVSALRDGAAWADQMRSEAMSRIEALEVVRQRLARLQREGALRIEEIVQRHLGELSTAVCSAIDVFADARAEELREQGIRGTSRQHVLDTGPLRREMEDLFEAGYRKLRLAVARGQKDLLAEATLATGETADQLRASLTEVVPEPIDPRPAMAALSDTVTLDLGSFVTRWLNHPDTVERKAEELARMIVGDFYPIAERLLESADEAVSGSVDATARALASAVERGLQELVARWQREKAMLEMVATRGNSERARARRRALERELEDIRTRSERLAACREAIAAELKLAADARPETR